MNWERRDGRTAVRIEQLDFANADAAGSASRDVPHERARAPAKSTSPLRRRASMRGRSTRYLPRVIDDATRRWLRTSLANGAATDVRLKLAGNLAEFPFAERQGRPVRRDGEGERA